MLSLMLKIIYYTGVINGETYRPKPLLSKSVNMFISAEKFGILTLGYTLEQAPSFQYFCVGSFSSLNFNYILFL